MMRPGQLHPNEFEVVLLQRLLAVNALPFVISDLHVLSREFTGVGCYTDFLVRNGPKVERQVLGIAARIRMPGLEHELGFHAFYEGDRILFETFTFGDDKWDGVFDGFEIQTAT
jgi:hypothetical protein